MNEMKKAGLLVGLLVSANVAFAGNVDPGSLKTSGPIDFASNLLTSSTPITDVEDFKYTVQVGTEKSIDNVYYKVSQAFNTDGTYDSGMLPHSDDTVSFRFSTSVKGAVATNQRSCHAGTDGSPDGVTCEITLPASYMNSRAYTVEVKKTADNGKLRTYSATVTDQLGGFWSDIGSWSVPVSVGALSPWVNASSVRYSDAKFKVTSCADIPSIFVDYSNVLFNNSVYSTLASNQPDPEASGPYMCSSARVPLSISKYRPTQTGFVVTND
ncbi:hypothetical protein [Burkholderia sp. 22PA0106]|uniref:hypothetical protein n=1 Tax=Burkholderia sp. 22PA0106 TaxID=3237371 RepID=UPI0039C37B9B